MRNTPGIRFTGSRKRVVWLHAGTLCEPQACAAALRILGLAAMAPAPNISKKHPKNKTDPYLLRGLSVVRPYASSPTTILKIAKINLI
jgi:putative transposase